MRNRSDTSDPLHRRAVEQMLVGVAMRQYARSLEPLPTAVTSRGTSKSAVSRRFVARTRPQFEAWQSTSLETLDLVGLSCRGCEPPAGRSTISP